eukprot:TRINITY_DN1299_c0_g1_i1.p1 TRINITY_DN1299_c0_g1~~TRINITY_DN1299_c0_g1_i1.p1  ORF type:complete len:278 (-),score=20.47 TRINITY_DN1299_c0_g1_i1:249-992(-)
MASFQRVTFALAGLQLAFCFLKFEDVRKHDCESDDVPTDAVGSCWELGELGYCEQKWMIQGEYCIKTCDFCGEAGGPLPLQVGRAAAFFTAEEQVAISYQNRTLRGCICPTWKFTATGVVHDGCSNPDNSPLGGWCPVDKESCAFDPYYTSTVPIDIVYTFEDGRTELVSLGGKDSPYHIDSCTCLPKMMCEKTQLGCKCSSPCSNPDLDLRGPWCFVDEDSCPEDFVNQKGGNIAIDYCKPGCCPE